MRKIVQWSVTVLLFTGMIVSCSKSPTDLVKRYAEIYNRHGVSDIVYLYADDAVFEVVGQFLFDKREQIRAITEYDSVLNIHMTVSNIKTSGDTAFFDLVETNDWIETAGIGVAKYSCQFIFKSGTITHIRAQANPETTEAFREVFNYFLPWAQKEKPQILAELIPDGKLIYSAESAKKLLTLFREWKQMNVTRK